MSPLFRCHICSIILLMALHFTSFKNVWVEASKDRNPIILRTPRLFSRFSNPLRNPPPSSSTDDSHNLLRSAPPTFDDEKEEESVSNHQIKNSNKNNSPSSSISPSSSAAAVTQKKTEMDRERTLPYRRNDPTNTPTSPWAALGAALAQNPHKVGRFVTSGIQVGLVFYVIRALWKTAAEVMEEYSAEVSSAADPSWLKRDDVTRVIRFLSLPPREQQAALASDGKANSKTSLPPLKLLHMAQSLVLAGLPLRASSSNDQSSVESVLLQITKSEASILQQCLWIPNQSTAAANGSAKESVWHQIAGLDAVKERLLGTLSTMRRQKGSTTQQAYASLFDNSNAAAGVLLYGPPGCGKTMLVKALSSVAKMPCLVITPSVLLRKYVGDTNLQVRSLFSLASKLAPCIVCIDELDGLFRERSENEHEVSRDLKTEFLQWVDGMMSESAAASQRPILLVGATNRPFDVDSAVLRRLPQAHYIGLPDATARAWILAQALLQVPTDPELNLAEITLRSEGYSPSDLRQVLQTAALEGPLKANIQHPQQPHSSRPLHTNDILHALRIIKPTPVTPHYRQAMANFVQVNSLLTSSAHSISRSNSNSHYYDGNVGNGWDSVNGQYFDAGTIEVDNSSLDASVASDLFLDITDEGDESLEEEDDDDEEEEEDVD
jgi:ATPase family AAA domain-containing protein 1